MKHGDSLLLAWRTTISRKGDDAAIFDTAGKIVQRFDEVEERARLFEEKIDALPAGAVVAVQIGNHEDWPSIFIACLRRQMVVLPLDESIGEQQRDAALKICRARSVVSAVPSGDSPQITRLGTTDTTARALQTFNAASRCCSPMDSSSGRTTICLRRQAIKMDGQSS